MTLPAADPLFWWQQLASRLESRLGLLQLNQQVSSTPAEHSALYGDCLWPRLGGQALSPSLMAAVRSSTQAMLQRAQPQLTWRLNDLDHEVSTDSVDHTAPVVALAPLLMPSGSPSPQDWLAAMWPKLATEAAIFWLGIGSESYWLLCDDPTDNAVVTPLAAIDGFNAESLAADFLSCGYVDPVVEVESVRLVYRDRQTLIGEISPYLQEVTAMAESNQNACLGLHWEIVFAHAWKTTTRPRAQNQRQREATLRFFPKLAQGGTPTDAI